MEVLDTPSGPVGRRARWHQILSKYDIEVGYISGKKNMICDILSRWAYPASEALQDISMHGSLKDDAEMLGIIDRELEEERSCMLYLKDQTCPGNLLIRGVVTRGGKSTNPINEYESTTSDSDSENSNRKGAMIIQPPCQNKNPNQVTNMSRSILIRSRLVRRVTL